MKRHPSLSVFYRLLILLTLLFSACEQDQSDPCQEAPFSDKRQTIETVSDVIVIIRRTVQHVFYFEVKDHPRYSNFYFDTEALLEFGIDAVDFDDSPVEGVHLKISGDVKLLCHGDPLFEIGANPIVITAIEKIKSCEIPYAREETKSFPVKFTVWKFVGFVNQDQTITFPTCEENNLYLKFSEEPLTDDPEGFEMEGDMSGSCSIKYKQHAENRFVIFYHICVLLVPSTTMDAKALLDRFTTALRDPEGITTEVDHNLLYIHSSVEEATLLFTAVE